MSRQESNHPARNQIGAQPVVATPHQAYRPLAAWPRASWLAVAAMLSSILCTPLSAVAGLTLGIFALVWIKRSQGKLDGRGLAIYAIVLSALVLLGWAIIALIHSFQMPHWWLLGP